MGVKELNFRVVILQKPVQPTALVAEDPDGILGQIPGQMESLEQ